MPTIFFGWVLLLVPGNGDVQLQMKSKEACLTALQSSGIGAQTAYACVNTETGEVIRRK